MVALLLVMGKAQRWTPVVVLLPLVLALRLDH